MRCPYCGSANIILNPQSDEYVCVNCGAVLGKAFEESMDFSAPIKGKDVLLPISDNTSLPDTRVSWMRTRDTKAYSSLISLRKNHEKRVLTRVERDVLSDILHVLPNALPGEKIRFDDMMALVNKVLSATWKSIPLNPKNPLSLEEERLVLSMILYMYEKYNCVAIVPLMIRLAQIEAIPRQVGIMIVRGMTREMSLTRIIKRVEEFGIKRKCRECDINCFSRVWSLILADDLKAIEPEISNRDISKGVELFKQFFESMVDKLGTKLPTAHLASLSTVVALGFRVRFNKKPENVRIVKSGILFMRTREGDIIPRYTTSANNAFLGIWLDNIDVRAYYNGHKYVVLPVYDAGMYKGFEVHSEAFKEFVEKHELSNNWKVILNDFYSMLSIRIRRAKASVLFVPTVVKIRGEDNVETRKKLIAYYLAFLAYSLTRKPPLTSPQDIATLRRSMFGRHLIENAERIMRVLQPRNQQSSSGETEEVLEYLSRLEQVVPSH